MMSLAETDNFLSPILEASDCLGYLSSLSNEPPNENSLTAGGYSSSSLLRKGLKDALFEAALGSILDGKLMLATL